MLTSDIAPDNIQRVLDQMRAVSRIAAGDPVGASTRVENAAGVDFGNILRAAVEQVSDVQQTATVNQQSFQIGESNMSLEEVMISLQKANLAFQGMIQVRNRLVEAYKEVASLQL